MGVGQVFRGKSSSERFCGSFGTIKKGRKVRGYGGYALSVNQWCGILFSTCCE